MDFKKVSELTAVAIPFLILCSSIQLWTYYGHWNIPIFDYLSTAEILFLFIWPMLTILFLGALYAVFMLILAGGAALWVLNTREAKPNEAEAPTTTSDGQSKAGRVYGVLSLAAMAIFGPLLLFQGIWYDYEIVPAVIVHVVIWFGACIGIWYLRGKKEEQLPLEWALVAAIPMLLSASFFYGRYQAHYATTYPVLQSIVLTDGTSFATDANVVYLGKTSGFYFYYKTVEKESLILPASQIKSVTIKPSN